MAKYLIEVEVDEDKLRRSKGIDVGEENEYEESIESLIIQEMGWVDDSGIYVRKIREISAKEDIKTVWDFVTAYFPNYYNSDLIALANDLQKIIDEEAEPESDAHDYFVNECNENMVTAKEHYEETHRRVYEMAIGEYLQLLKNNS